MDVYLVGGAVRDALLGRPVQDRDWVVVGGSAAELEALGYTQVGQDFPVFLHPQTKEEYALARTERRTGSGHKGFVVNAERSVTLEEDLERRDLTINAMALDAEDRLIDPFGGKADLESRTLRAVSDAFAEDPLRILRVARFASQLPEFSVHSETTSLMRGMVKAGLLEELPGERIWQEFYKALQTPHVAQFFAVLDSVDGWQPFFTEFQTATALSLETQEWDALERFALLCEALSAEQVRSFCKRVRAPNAFRDWALLTLDVAEPLSRWRSLSPVDRVAYVQRASGFHQLETLGQLEVYLRHRYGAELQPLVTAVRNATDSIRANQFAGVQGKALGEALQNARAQALEDAAQR